MNLDIATLQLVLVITFLSSFVVVLFLWRINKEENAISYWLLSAVVGAASFFVLEFRRLIGSFSTFFNNVGVTIALLLILIGILKFRKLHVTKDIRNVLILVVVLAMIFSGLFKENPTYRFLFMDMLYMLLLLISSYVIVKKTKGMEFFISAISSVAFLLFVPVLAYRWYLAYSGQITGINPLTIAPGLLSMLYLITIPAVFGWTMGLNLILNYQNNQKLEAMALKDNLTNTSNRRNLEITFNQIAKQQSNQQHFLFLLDINDFKDINDTYGHVIGDEVLIHVADSLTNCIRNTDIVVRYGGDEFIVLLTKQEKDNPQSIIKRFINQINTPMIIKNISLVINVSLGYATFPIDGFDLETLIHHADKQMYKHKNQQNEQEV